MNTNNFTEGDNGLQSQFEALRALPIAPPSRALAGLQFWRYFARHARMIGPLFLLMAFLAIIIPLTIFQAKNNFTRADNKFGRTTGRVLQIERITPDWAEPVANQRSYFIKYRFETEGRAYTGTASLDNTFNGVNAAELKIDGAVPISYLINNPERSGLRQEEGIALSQLPVEFFLLFAPLALALMGPMLFPIFRLWRRARRLVQSGQLCNGRVIWIATLPPLGQGGASEFEVHYEFVLNSETHTGKLRCNNFWLVQHLPPHAPIVVAYDATQPKRSVFLEPFVA